ncbi:RNA polymerase sigma factor [Sutcliffiella sp. NPDC057660]|uniref:RNA polymerase sigma factor n=1 Tax=Sutcliffiella sp. NPDC057660 TaxID=3346199 RepID=UPI003692ECE4
MSDPRIEIYENHKQAIYSYLYRSTLNRHIAEDLTQETFFRAFKSLSTYRGEASMKTWLFKIARNTYINFSVKKQTQLEVHFETLEERLSVQQNPYKHAEDKLLIQMILVKLPENYRSYILLRDENGLTYGEIADITNKSIAQVKVGIYRARKKFREIYKKEVGEER